MGLEKGLKEQNKNVLGSWKKGNTPNPARKAWQHSSAVTGKTECSTTRGELAEEMSGVGGGVVKALPGLFTVYCKMQQERDKLKSKLLWF